MLGAGPGRTSRRGHGRAHRRDTLVRRSRDRSRRDPLRHPRARVRPGIELPAIPRLSHRRLHLRPSRASQETRDNSLSPTPWTKPSVSTQSATSGSPYSQPTAHPIPPSPPIPVVQTIYSDLWLVPDAPCTTDRLPDRDAMLLLPGCPGRRCLPGCLPSRWTRRLACRRRCPTDGLRARERSERDPRAFPLHRGWPRRGGQTSRRTANRRMVPALYPTPAPASPARPPAMALPGLNRLLSSRLVAGAGGYPDFAVVASAGAPFLMSEGGLSVSTCGPPPRCLLGTCRSDQAGSPQSPSVQTLERPRS